MEDLTHVGPHLRLIRQERGMTLAAVSAATGVNVSTLSRLEAGRRRPTLELLLPLSRCYRLPLDELVAAPPVADPRVFPKPRLRNGVVVIPLSAAQRPQQAIKLVIPAAHCRPRPRSHPGFEWLYVLAGTLRLVLGEQDLRLAAGQAAEFNTAIPHWFGSTGAGTVEVLSLLSRSGQRIHLASPAAADDAPPPAGP
ncbi:helix-turn-helix domain-containing protein [Buchananella hordeovulneris]|uniref:helix-turn-helix domain-containing protein n=1 Tax=Buchananella hordeovulneris TaxID=52770 RepID=UPI000F5E1E68|nr:XRE family transcriptional regulator [Buchananella hordeovulneris]RRD42084.1 XRE family transcriptional regulator [Buchananella hordeovulneris]RRD50378.1 XRE family transcriptional regulator [Buchananella hordeovulneris]